MTVNFNQIQAESNTPSPAKDARNEKQLSTMDKINNYLLRFSKVPLKEKLFFIQNLQIMLKAGISISKALKTLSLQSNNKLFQFVLNDLADKIEGGTSFAESLIPHKKVFGEMFINMVEAGELSGKLEDVLRELYIQAKKEHALISKVKGAMTYPAVILMAMFGIGTFMLVYIVPKITSMFDEMGAELPLPTKILIGVSDALVENGALSAIIFVAVVFSFFRIIKTEKGKFYFHKALLTLPIIGPIIKKINIARFARNISSLLKTDIMIIKSFQITANVMGNVHYKNALNEMASQIKKGANINEILNNYPKLFPPMVTQMVAIGEETGEIDNVLSELAEFYEEEVDQVMESLPTIIEPLLILTLGLGVGGVAVAIVLPMYSITDSI